jgi:hypothetical protein
LPLRFGRASFRFLNTDIENDVVAKQDHDLTGSLEEEFVSETVIFSNGHPR